MSAQEIADRILGGDADDDISTVIDAIKTRQRKLAHRQSQTFSVGDRVEVYRPGTKHHGLPATVIKVNRKTVDIETLDGGQVRADATLLRRA